MMAGIPINYSAFDRRDYDTGRWKCRLCEKPAQPPKQYYCSNEHRRIFHLGISWPQARYLALKRDNYRCVKCGKIVAGHHHTYDEGKKKFVYSKEIANIHHVIPVSYLWGEIFKALEGCPASERDWRMEQLMIMVFFHIDNLITLCEDPCHKEEHKSGWYDKFKMMDTGQKTLEVFMSE